MSETAGSIHIPPSGFVELHCHVDGLVSPAMVEALGDLPIDADALAAITPVTSRLDWMETWSATVEPCFQPWTRMLAMLAFHVEALAQQGVTYTEILMSRLLMPPGEPTDEGALRERFELCHEAADAAADGRIDVQFVATVGRGPRAGMERKLALVRTLARTELICGVAIAGDENACTIESICDLLAPLVDDGLGLEIHAGEVSGPENVWDALTASPQRIGHGLSAFDDMRLIEELRRRDVHLEFCPTSNVVLGSVQRIREHPIARARELGMSFSISTDDPGPLGCTLTSEHALVERALGFGPIDFDMMRIDAWRSRFAHGG